MVSYLYRMPTGIVGDITRTNGLTTEPATITPLGTTGHPLSFGVPVVADQTGGNVGNMRTVTAADVRIYGLLVREFPTAAAQDGIGTTTVPTAAGSAVTVMRRGYMSVLLSGSTASLKGAPVFIWTAAASGSHIVGGFESTDPGASGFVLPNTFFEGAADALGVVEIAYNI